jgi:glycosyltransferase involved in cell wall biosynthesis
MPEMPVVLDTRVVTGCGGGPEKTIFNSPRYLSAAGYRMLCAYMHPPRDPGFDELRARAEAKEAPLFSIPDRGPWDWRVVPSLLEVCRRERVQIWHAHDYKSNALGMLLQRWWPMRLVATVHGWVQHTYRTPLYYGLDRLVLPRYEKVLCVSPDLYERCRSYGVPEERCLLIENGIDTQEYARTRSVAEAKRFLGIPPERQVIGAVGRLSAEKGFDLLVRAVDQLLYRERDVELLILGEGAEATRLHTLIAQLGRSGRCRLLGHQADPKPYYEAMDVFALSSLREGLPNVLLEALALEVPVVATAVAGVPSLIQDGHNGLLVRPGALDPLTNALARLLGDADLRARCRTAGRATVETRWSFAGRMNRLRAVYDELLTRH